MTPRLAIAIVLTTAPLAAQAPVFRAVIESVVVDVSVERRGRPVTDLRATDFQLRDNGIVQSILDVSQETLPIDITLVIDTSGSVQGPMLASLRRAIAAVGTQLRPTDRAKLVTFNQRVREASGYTTGRLPETTAALSAPVGQTSVFDALALSVVEPVDAGRRPLTILFTDGADTVSFLDDEEILATTTRSGMAVFIVAVAPGSVALRRPAAHEELFGRIAEATGGQLQVLQRNEDLGPAFVRAFTEFRASYVLRYVVQGQAKPGWRELDVRITRPGRYDVRARKGYFGGR